ncbi:protein of unknown function DUF1236 [Ancylobacter novellus DSM 506]|uniref:Glycine zipper domain-containing protein n=1 Tax=Ancylobacter novellus (strain ATCC 8093 / DSM 506 / JCM 20403 / CCM 1077 / IAM 12100 / NBRC 12443 / NCIMB 10456) TaxID=639283 RepID=D7A517_ANCN5|nr:DUF1236 domain-containing protein [Ancylobacter novellus]ADH89905.1 protein of unknown function DUF1236 [Ancylobacter novellus DSM 506]
MIRHAIIAASLLVAAPVVANAQDGAGTAAGATTGAVGGAIVGGPVGAVVGGVAGAVIGGISDDHRARFRQYVVQERVPSYTYQREVVVGTELPTSGVRYYEVPAEYGTTQYRYTVVNDRTVLVDPSTHRVVQIIN